MGEGGGGGEGEQGMSIKHFPCQTGVQSCTKRDNPNTLNLIVNGKLFPFATVAQRSRITCV